MKSNVTLQDSGVKNGEMVHVVKKKQEETAPPRVTYTDAELQGLNTALRSLGCTPNAPGWTRAMQVSACHLVIWYAIYKIRLCATLQVHHPTGFSSEIRIRW